MCKGAQQTYRTGADIAYIHTMVQDGLLQYMRREGIVAGSVSAIHLQQFGHGQSNPTYFLKVRKQPAVYQASLYQAAMR